MRNLERCHYCDGPIVAVTGPGRWRTYRGVECEIPADFAINTCTACRREWIPDEDIGTLSASFEKQRLARNRTVVREVRPTGSVGTRVAASSRAATTAIAAIIVSTTLPATTTIVAEARSATSQS